MIPVVSVCIPCHNAESYVAAALDSVLSQSYRAIEVVVVNDGSTDGSSEVLNDFEDRGVVVIHEKCGSASKARNRALRESRGEYIKFFDADDLLHPQMIEKQVERLNGSHQDVAFSGWGRFYNDDLSTFELSPQPVWRDMDAREWLVESLMDARPMMQPGQFLAPRSLIEKCGGWDETLSLIDDFEFFSRLLSLAKNLKFCSDTPLFYRSGLVGSLSKRKSRDAVESAFHSLLKGTQCLINAQCDKRTKEACANVLQDFEYMYYPDHEDLRRLVLDRIKELGGSTLRPDGPPNFKRLSCFLGWKLARRLQRFLRG
ncbi:MAG: glycosyltransferase family 2 protein [Pirellula sp.]